MNFLRRLALQEKILNDSSCLDVADPRFRACFLPSLAKDLISTPVSNPPAGGFCFNLKINTTGNGRMNVASWRVRVTIVAVGTEYVLHILSVYM